MDRDTLIWLAVAIAIAALVVGVGVGVTLYLCCRRWARLRRERQQQRRTHREEREEREFEDEWYNDPDWWKKARQRPLSDSDEPQGRR